MQHIYTQLPVADRAEVVVCGGGTAGTFAAIAAAREGREALLVEQLGMLGGSATAALVTPVMHSGIGGDPPCSYLSDLVRDRLLARGACSPDGCAFDPLQLKIVLEELCREYGVRILYHTFIAQVVAQGGMSLDEIMDVYWASLGSIRKGQLTLVFPLETLHDLSYRRMAGGSLA